MASETTKASSELVLPIKTKESAACHLICPVSSLFGWSPEESQQLRPLTDRDQRECFHLSQGQVLGT